MLPFGRLHNTGQFMIRHACYCVPVPIPSKLIFTYFQLSQLGSKLCDVEDEAVT